MTELRFEDLEEINPRPWRYTPCKHNDQTNDMICSDCTIEAEVREQVAAEIETESLRDEYQDGYPGSMKRVGMSIAAEIARGQK